MQEGGDEVVDSDDEDDPKNKGCFVAHASLIERSSQAELSKGAEEAAEGLRCPGAPSSCKGPDRRENQIEAASGQTSGRAWQLR